MDSMEDISPRVISWQKQIGDQFYKIAEFLSLGSGQWNMISINNRIKFIAPNTLPSPVMIIKDPLCSDQGVYQCWIGYFSYSNYSTRTSRSIVTFKGNYVFSVNLVSLYI